MTDQALEKNPSMRVHLTSFERFFRDLSGDVYRALFASLGDSDLAEEATSEGFLACFRD